jgi:hypothetical protein
MTVNESGIDLLVTPSKLGLERDLGDFAEKPTSQGLSLQRKHTGIPWKICLFGNLLLHLSNQPSFVVQCYNRWISCSSFRSQRLQPDDSLDDAFGVHETVHVSKCG